MSDSKPGVLASRVRRRRRLTQVAIASALVTVVVTAWRAPWARPEVSSTLLADADRITRQVETLRGLSAKHAIVKGVVTRQQVKARMTQRIRELYRPDEVRAEGRILERLGLLPEGTDYEGTITALLMEQVAGFYDP